MRLKGAAGIAFALVFAAVRPAPGQSAAPAAPAPQRPSFLGARTAAIVTEHLDGTPFKIPQGVFYDAAQDEVFVADSGNGLIGIFDGNGVPKFTFRVGATGTYPVSVFTDLEGNIYVLNAGAPKVSVFDYRGQPLGEIGPDEVDRAKPVLSGMGLGPDGRIYLLDGSVGRILVCELDGRLVRTIKGSGKGGSRLQAPYDIAFDPEGGLYVSDRRGTPVQVYTPYGSYLHGWGMRDLSPGGFSTPSGIAVDPYGRVLVADPIRQDVKVFEPGGKFYTRLGGVFGEGPGEMAYPTDVAAGREGRLFVVERVGRRLQILDRIPLSDAPSGARR